jgi:hypothetical protein
MADGRGRWPKQNWHPALKQLDKTQHELNQFLWSTDFACAVLSQSGLLRSRHSTPAYKAYRGVTCAAFFPSRKGEPHYKASVGKLKKQLRDNVNDLYPAVAAQFFACFEEFVSGRFIALAGEDDRLQVSRPLVIWREILRTYSRRNSPKTPDDRRSIQLLVLQVDLLKWIRNAYAHRGADAIPLGIDHPLFEGWSKDVQFLDDECDEVPKLVAEAKKRVVEEAVQKRDKNHSEGRSADPRMFYTLFTFANVRALAEELDRQFDREPKPKREAATPEEKLAEKLDEFDRFLRNVGRGSVVSPELRQPISQACKLARDLKKKVKSLVDAPNTIHLTSVPLTEE